MPSWLLMIVILTVGCITSACVTARICDNDNVSESEWQLIKYTGSSVEPKCIYVCKECNNQRDINYRYCDNCGARMINGVARIYYTNGINLDLDE